MTRWKSIALSVRREALEAMSHFLMERGALGTVSDERLFGPAGDPADPIPPPGERTLLTAWFPPEADLSALRGEVGTFLPSLRGIFGDDAASLEGVAETEDPGWGEAWKEHFRPAKAGERIVVRPSWEPYEPAPGEVVLTIDPGQAFGTGSHETTRLCLRFLEEILARPDPPGRILDVGTGTGILGIAALRLGAREATGIDVDPKAVETALENARTNGVGDRFRAATGPLPSLPTDFDLAVANLTAEVLLEMAGELAGRVRPGGLLLLSGIVEEKKEWVRDGFLPLGFRPVGERSEGQWTALLLRREAGGG